MVWGVQGCSTYWRCYSPTKSYPTLWVKCYVVMFKKARESTKHLYKGIELGADIFWDTIIYSHDVVIYSSQNLAGNDLGSRGARLISDSLRKNRTITKLNISGNAALTLYSVIILRDFCCHHWYLYVKKYLLFIRITDVKNWNFFSFKTDTIIHISVYTYGCKLKSRCRTESHSYLNYIFYHYLTFLKHCFKINSNKWIHFFIFRKQFFGKRCNSYGKTYLGKPRFVCTYLYLSEEHRQQFNLACK